MSENFSNSQNPDQVNTQPNNSQNKPLDPKPTQKSNSNKTIIWSIVAGVLLTTVIFSTLAFAIFEVLSPTSKITVGGQAVQKVKPDEAEVSFYLSKNGLDPVVLNTQIDLETQKILDYLEKEGLGKNDFKTNKSSYPDYYPTYDMGLPRTEKPQTRVEVQFTVILKDLQKDLSRPNKILNEVSKLGVSRFDQLNYNVQNRKEICLELQAKAISDGYKRGEDQVKSLGGNRVVKREVQPVTDCLNQNLNYPVYKTSMAESGSAGSSSAPSVSTGEEEILAQVNVILDYK